VRKPPLLDAFWSFGSKAYLLILLYLPASVLLWGGVVLAIENGIVPRLFVLTQSSLLSAVTPFFVVVLLWQPVFAAGACLTFARNRARDAAIRAALMESYGNPLETPPDIAALRRARQVEQDQRSGA
jgi:hypothetical protein